MRSKINRGNAPYILRLLDHCFKQGVIDAANLEDDYAVKEWLDARKADHGYGLLSETGDDFDWKRWRFTLYRWCRDLRMNKLGELYIDRLRYFQNSMEFAIIPVSMHFYLLGVEEWLEYPNPLNMTIFKSSPKTHWKPMPKHLREMTRTDMVNMIQDYVYKRTSMNLEGDMAARRYDDFSLAVWRCLQKYPSYYAPADKDL